MLRELADNTSNLSLAYRLRRERFLFFQKLVDRLSPPLSILDVGGTPEFWEHMGFPTDERISITLLNVVPIEAKRPNFVFVPGDARSMPQIQDQQFDVVFSNSVIEHVSSFDEQRMMAAEIIRVGKRYFVQTPNRYFPLEPHFLVPCFQFFPLTLRAWLLSRFDLGWAKKTEDYEIAKIVAENVRLLSRRELKDLFPSASIYEERMGPLVKSFIAYNGF